MKRVLRVALPIVAVILYVVALALVIDERGSRLLPPETEKTQQAWEVKR